LAVAHNSLGLALKTQGNLDGAIECHQKAIALNPKYAQAYNNVGNALLLKQDPEGAITWYKKALGLDPKDAQTHTNLGTALFKKGKFEDAMECYKKALALDPKLAGAYSNMGAALKAKGDLQGAIECFRKAVEVDPKDSQSHYNLGTALEVKGDWPGTIAAYQAAIACDPKYALAHNNLGNAFKASKDPAKAVDCYRQAIACDPQYVLAHFNLGLTLRDLGEFAEALQELRLGQKLAQKKPGPAYPSALWIKQCEQLMSVDQKLTAILDGKAQPQGAIEQLVLGDLCAIYKKQYVAAAQFYTDAFSATPPLAEDVIWPHRYHAARAAALAAAGKGKDAGALGDKEKTKWRQQALAWLQADLALWQRQATGDAAARAAVAKTLAHWQSDPDLASVRDEKALAQLPDAERKTWQQFWGEVNKIAQQVKK
jgi:tetratricopeptide (TPR) repeat protein